jgi:hypothetical protein
MVTAKFKVSRLTEASTYTEVELTPDYASGRNAEWAQATPSGVIRLTITNPDAIAYFEQDAPYTVTFEREQ